MAICPIYLISTDNSVYTYEAIDCNDPTKSYVLVSASPQVCGCDPATGECASEEGGGTGGMASERDPIKPLPAYPSHIVHEDLAAKGLAAVLPHDHVWAFPISDVNPAFAGDEAYHVVKVDGKERFIRVFAGKFTPPATLYLLSYEGKVAKFTPLPPVDVAVGQETVVPPGVVPRPMVLTAKPTKTGGCYVKCKRGGKADSTVFHVLLKK